ncbi:urease subunit gamma [Planosporangium sp. 12N6]|uniref:urease subunit gamma n=1 Tax=Planosporangium spinosum TaxID=3402278 RepID=UPI003CFB56D9
MDQEQSAANRGDESGVRTSSAPGTETWISSLMLTPRETQKLVIYQVADLARRRKARGVKLNFPESIALICEVLLEAARDGRSLAEVQQLGKQVLTRDDVMPEVPDMVTLVQVEATFRTGTQLISVSNPIP